MRAIEKTLRNTMESIPTPSDRFGYMLNGRDHLTNWTTDKNGVERLSSLRTGARVPLAYEVGELARRGRIRPIEVFDRLMRRVLERLLQEREDLLAGKVTRPARGRGRGVRTKRR